MSKYHHAQPCASQAKHFKALGCIRLETGVPAPGYVGWGEVATGFTFDVRADREFKNTKEAAHWVFAEVASQAANRVRRQIKDALKIA